VIRIGRSTDNHVILYSAVVSRHHVELRRTDDRWEIVNLGANGTYLDGKRITQVPVEDGVVIRLARSGPNVQIHLSAKAAESSRAMTGEKTLAQRITPKITDIQAAVAEGAGANEDLDRELVPVTNVPASEEETPSKLLSKQSTIAETDPPSNSLQPNPCCLPHQQSELLFCPTCGQPLRPLETVGKYQIVKFLEQRGTVIDYLGWRDGQTVILRSPNPEMQQPDHMTVYGQMLKALLPLEHPGLAAVLDVFSVENRPYLVLEPIYGKNLEEWVATNGPVPLPQAIAWMVQICHVLHYLHRQTPVLVHQAIQPLHLVRRTRALESYDIVVTGLALGKNYEPPSEFPSTSYAAPEQPQQISPAVDLYALGPTLVYLLTGQSPNQFYAHREQGFRFYPEYIPGLPSEVATVVRKLTQPDPGDRYSSALEVSKALQQILMTAS